MGGSSARSSSCRKSAGWTTRESFDAKSSRQRRRSGRNEVEQVHNSSSRASKTVRRWWGHEEEMGARYGERGDKEGDINGMVRRLVAR